MPPAHDGDGGLVCPDAANHCRISRPVPSAVERRLRCNLAGMSLDAISRLYQGLIKAKSMNVLTLIGSNRIIGSKGESEKANQTLKHEGIQ